MGVLNLHSPGDLVKDPIVALNYLKEGNQRFVSDNLMPRDVYKEDLKVIAGGQKPFAVVLTCSDSRVAPEIFFDQKLGDIFVIRNAGNYPDQDALGSLEFAIKVLGAVVVVVVGHTECGAVHNSFAGASGLPSNLQAILDNIRKNIASSSSKEAAVGDHVRWVVDVIKNNEVVKECDTMIVGAEYNIATGEVSFH